MRATLPRRLSTKVVGVSFVDGYPDNLLALDGEDVELALRREVDNPHDANAVAVVVDGGPQLGHLPAALAARFAPELDAGTVWWVTGWDVLVMPGAESQPGLTLNLERGV